MARGTSPLEEGVIVVRPRMPGVLASQAIPGDETRRLADFVRAEARADGGAVPLTRTIRGRFWIAFQRVVLDEIADDPWYDTVPLDEPVQVLFSGAIRTVKNREDEALVKLARCIR